MKIKVKQIYFYLFLILLILMPLHYVLFSLILGELKLLSLWRDGLIALLFLYGFQRKAFRIGRYERWILIAIDIIMLYAIFFLDTVSLNMARTYIMPMLIFFYVKNERFSLKESRQIVKVIWMMAVIESVYGIYQAFVLGSQFLIDLGYSSIEGRLASSSFYIAGNWDQQRVCGTFVSPNNCGAYLAMSVIILVTLRDFVRSKKWIYYSGIMVIMLGLLGTLSRSAWAGCLAGIVLFDGNDKDKKKKLLRLILTSVTLLCVGLVADHYIFKGRIFSIVLHHVANTLDREPSFNAHIRDIYKPALNVIRHPFGLGFGKNGSFVLRSVPAGKVNLVESSIYVICYDIGAIGAIVYFMPYLKAIASRGKTLSDDVCVRCAAKIGACVLIIYLLLPSVQAYEQPFAFFVFLGLAEQTHALRSQFERRGELCQRYLTEIPR